MVGGQRPRPMWAREARTRCSGQMDLGLVERYLEKKTLPGVKATGGPPHRTPGSG